MTVVAFEKKHGLTRNNIAISIHQKLIPDIRVSLPKDVGFYIDETFFLRRKEFYKKIQLFNHDMYYLLSNYFSNSAIARSCAKYNQVEDEVDSLNTFIGKGLFKRPSDSIVNYKVKSQMWKYFKYFRAIHRDLNRKFINFDLEITLDRMM